jgi:ferredoxin-NADP reductase
MTVTEAPARPDRRLEWRLVEVREILVETPRVKSLLLQIDGWPGHLAGQHVDVRLTSEDGYQAQRSYSIASAPEDSRVALTVEKIDDGEVSPYLVDDVRQGGQFELRGPIGGYFVWTAQESGPLSLIAGGSGVAPLMGMLRHRQRAPSRVPTILLYSSKSLEDVIYREELAEMARLDPSLTIITTLTREHSRAWSGRRGRIDRALLMEACFPPRERPLTYICGPTQLVEDVSRDLVELGYDPPTIRTERFGPTGG